MSERVDTLERSREKAVDLSFALMAYSLAAGDRERFELGRAGLRHVGYPGGEGAPTIADAVKAVPATEEGEA